MRHEITLWGDERLAEDPVGMGGDVSWSCFTCGYADSGHDLSSAIRQAGAHQLQLDDDDEYREASVDEALDWADQAMAANGMDGTEWAWKHLRDGVSSGAVGDDVWVVLTLAEKVRALSLYGERRM